MNAYQATRVHTVPSTLNSKCPTAAFLAARLAPSEASSGVMVVPMLLPSTMAQAMSKGIHPLVAITSTMAKVAALDCITSVTTRPTVRKMSTDQNPMLA